MSLNVKMSRAVDKHGLVVAIEDVKRGSACECNCDIADISNVDIPSHVYDQFERDADIE